MTVKAPGQVPALPSPKSGPDWYMTTTGHYLKSETSTMQSASQAKWLTRLPLVYD